MKPLLLALLILSPPALAAPLYTLDKGASTVSFIARADGFTINGAMPVTTARATVDLGDVGASTIDVTVSTRAIRAGFALATSTVKSAQVLDVANHGEMRFVARDIRRSGNRAVVTGDLTVKGVTRPIILNATFFRTEATDAQTLPRIGVRLTGTTDRFDFGVNGFPKLVEREVEIDIRAWFDRVDG